MRCLCALLALGCLVGLVGCDKHVAGVCDCTALSGPHCASCCAWHHFAPGVQMEHIRPKADNSGEPLKAMPKEMPKGDKTDEGKANEQ